MKCTLCGSDTKTYEVWREKEYLKCKGCNALLLNSKDYLNAEQEKRRYQEHNNDVYDPRYQKFVSPIVDGVLRDYGREDLGLDFGAGTGPVITKMLKDQGYDIKIYDPFFANYPGKLEEKYDYIVCCEVMEHFHNPREEFQLMKSLLKEGGSIYLKTQLYSEEIDFASWGYKNDDTHVFFYHRKGLEWIRENIGFSSLLVEEDRIIYRI